MNTREPGVLSDSRIYLHEPSAFSRLALIYVPFSGEYHCIEPYAIRRTYLDCIILLAVDNGQLELTDRGRTIRLTAGCLGLIDCKETHSYRAIGDLHFRWIHINGSNSQHFYDRLSLDKNPVPVTGKAATADPIPVIDLKHHPIAQTELNVLFQQLRQPYTDDLQINLAMTQFLSTLLQIAENKPAVQNITIHRAFQYMTDHFREDLSLEDIARTINMSPCHFARLFRIQYACPPHDYLLNLRLLDAKKRLLTTTQSIEEIAADCGFNSPSHFIRTFGKRVGKTPTQFRKTKF